MTRKGLAIGAAASLALAGFVGIPASAAGLADKSFVSLVPATGTSYNVVASKDKTFRLKSNEASSIVSGPLSFLVEDADSAVFPVEGAHTTTFTYADAGATIASWDRADGVVTLTFSANNHGFVTGEILQVTADLSAGNGEAVIAGYYTVTDGAASAPTVSFVDGLEDGDASSTLAVTVVKQSNIVRAENGNFVVNTTISNSSADELLELAVMSDSAVSVNVTAWVDANSNGEIDSTEYTSPTRTVNFLSAAQLSATITWDAAFGVAAVSADVVFSPTLNLAQTVGADLPGTFSNFAVSAGLGSASVSIDALTNTLTYSDEVTASGFLPKGNLRLVIDNKDEAEVATFNLNIVDLDVALVIPTVVDGANLKAGSVTSTGTPVDVREKTTSVTVTVEVLDSEDAPVAGAVVTVSSGSNTAITGTGKAATVGPNAVKANDTFDSFTVTTNSSGTATVVVTNTLGTDQDTIELDFASNGVSIQSTGNASTITLDWDAATYTTSVVSIVHAEATAGDQAGNASGEGLTIAKGGSLAVTTRTADQWNVAPANGVYRISNVLTQNSETADPAFANVSGGTATVLISDNTATGDSAEIEAVITRDIYSAATQNWSTETGGTEFGAADNVTLYAAPRDAVSGVVTVDNLTDNVVTAAAAVGTKALVAGNTKLGEAASEVTGDGVTVAGSVQNSLNGADLAGLPVTVSGASHLLFVADGVYSFGSLTAWSAGDDGAYSFKVYSTRAGTFDVTVSASGGTKTVGAKFNAALPAAGKTLTLSVANAVPGSTMVVTGTVLDAFGNPVKAETTVSQGNVTLTPISVVYSGPGFLVGDLPTATDADGKFEFRVLLGSNDVVTGSVTATYRPAGVAADNITTVANIGAAAAGTSRGWTRFLSATNELKIYARDVVGAGKVQFMVNGKEIAWIRAVDATDPKLNVASDGMVRSVFVSDMLVGKNVIEIYEDGVRIARRIYTR